MYHNCCIFFFHDKLCAIGVGSIFDWFPITRASQIINNKKFQTHFDTILIVNKSSRGALNGTGAPPKVTHKNNSNSNNKNNNNCGNNPRQC